MKLTALMSLLGLLLWTPWLQAQQMSSTQAESVDPEAIIKFRIQRFEEVEKTFKALRFEVVVNRSQDRYASYKMANTLADQVQPLLEAFRLRTDQQRFAGKTRARSEIWVHRDEFEEQMIDFIVRTERIAELLRAGNMSEAANLINVTAKGCKRCHRMFRSRW
ncbi:Cytochrome c556 [Allopseudospirillum japonicum]|uniref:Cytochrome c556 n=1 Tax=Allopseudospirillum japonicum TaxID=64971 RepID=A0A1H6Q9P8_9GAMM|nr:cytochrome c [Allopseudospirillum japonicum]SEI37544.1 Cytochrome c556 [Allopseudospirillum japonicum]